MAYEQLKLDKQLCFRLYTASRLITQSYHTILNKLGITYPQYLVLMVLWTNDNLLVNEIGKQLVLEYNTLSPLLQRMEKEGLIIRSKGPADGRHTLVSLTRKGRELETKASVVPYCLADKLHECGLQDESVALMIPLLDELIDKLKDNRK